MREGAETLPYGILRGFTGAASGSPTQIYIFIREGAETLPYGILRGFAGAASGSPT